MRLNLVRSQRHVVDGNFIDGAVKVIGPTVASSADGPIGAVDWQGSYCIRGAGDLGTITEKFPVGAIISANEINPGATSEISRGHRERGAVEVSAVRSANDIVRAGTFDPEEDFVAPQQRPIGF